MERRKPVLSVQPGEFVVSIDGREINARLTEILPCRAGQRVSGPRGGKYALTVAGASRLVIAVCGAKRPIVKIGAFAVVLGTDNE